MHARVQGFGFDLALELGEESLARGGDDLVEAVGALVEAVAAVVERAVRGDEELEEEQAVFVQIPPLQPLLLPWPPSRPLPSAV